jgi:DNA-binding cell septation regulator SpoVG
MKLASVIEFEKDKFVCTFVLSRKQLKGYYQDLFEPLSRSWRGDYQKGLKEIVRACREHGTKLTGRKK